MQEPSEREFKCYMCGGVFTPNWSEEDALAELSEQFPGCDKCDCVQVCDSCWEKVKPENNEELYTEFMGGE